MKKAGNYILVFIFVLALSLTLTGYTAFELNLRVAISAIVAFVLVLMLRHRIAASRFSFLLLVCAFLLISYVPLLGPKEVNSFEKRELAAFPHWRWSNVWNFFFGFTEYFNDRFSHRNEAVQRISRFRFRLFHVSTMPHIVDRGKGDWIYRCADSYVNSISKPFTAKELEVVSKNLEIITKYFELRNTKYYIAIIPAKEHVYREYMSDLLLYRTQFSIADQVYNYISSNENIRSVYPKEILIKGKEKHPTYYNTDTHWNPYGAFLGYSEIIKLIKRDFPEISPSALEDYNLKIIENGEGGDTQMLLGFIDEIPLYHIILRPKSGIYPVILNSKDQGPPEWRYEILEMPNIENKLKMVLVRDSFSEFLKNYLCRDFKHSELIWNPVVPVAKVVEVKPDIVVHEMMEMFVHELFKLPPEIESDTAFLNKFYPGYYKEVAEISNRQTYLP